MDGPKLLIRCIDSDCGYSCIREITSDTTMVIQTDYSGKDRVNNIRIEDICHDPTVRRRILLCPKEKNKTVFVEYQEDPSNLRLCYVCTSCKTIIK